MHTYSLRFPYTFCCDLKKKKKKDSKYQRFAKRLYCGFSCDRDEIGEYYSEDWDIITKLKKCSTNYLLQ